MRAPFLALAMLFCKCTNNASILSNAYGSLPTEEFEDIQP